MTEEKLEEIKEIVPIEGRTLAKATTSTTPSDVGGFYMPSNDTLLQNLGLTPEKLVIPKEYHEVLKLCYDFYQRGGIVGTVINRLAELTITEIRNGQRGTSDGANEYFYAVLHRRPSRLMRFLYNAALEFFVSGMVIPRVDWVEKKGAEVSAKLDPNRTYIFPVFDMYPSQLIEIEWADWGEKDFYVRVPSADIKLIRRDSNSIKSQQLQRRYQMLIAQYSSFVDTIKKGADTILITDADPILRKELTVTAYPTPMLFNVLEALVFKQQLRRMDFAVASRVINAILLVREGNDNYPITDETRDNLDELKVQIQARSGNQRLQERLFMLFSNHTTQLDWITPDVQALLDQEKYKQTNEEIAEGLGFAKILVTGESRYANAAEVSTWAIQPQMEEFRSMVREWLLDVYDKAAEENKFRNTPEPNFRPIRLQDVIKTASVFQAAFTEGNVSRTSRAESVGLDFETEVELMKDEKDLMKGLDAFPAMPYSPPPPTIGGATKPGGRPTGSKNVAINKRNTGVKPKGQKPVARVAKAELMEDEEVIALIDKIALERGIIITEEILEDVDEEV